MVARFLRYIGLFALIVQGTACERDVSFANDVAPILQRQCAECHSPEGEGYLASGFGVSDHAAVMQGARFGPVVVPGSRISSTLYRVIDHKTAPEIQMPPHHMKGLPAGRAAPLTTDQIEMIGLWIDQGAKNN